MHRMKNITYKKMKVKKFPQHKHKKKKKYCDYFYKYLCQIVVKYLSFFECKSQLEIFKCDKLK